MKKNLLKKSVVLVALIFFVLVFLILKNNFDSNVVNNVTEKSLQYNNEHLLTLHSPASFLESEAIPTSFYKNVLQLVGDYHTVRIGNSVLPGLSVNLDHQTMSLELSSIDDQLESKIIAEIPLKAFFSKLIELDKIEVAQGFNDHLFVYEDMNVSVENEYISAIFYLDSATLDIDILNSEFDLVSYSGLLLFTLK